MRLNTVSSFIISLYSVVLVGILVGSDVLPTNFE